MSETHKPSVAGQTALITGASRGIGRAVALRLGRLGARLLLVARDHAALGAVQQEIAQAGGEAEAIPCELTSDRDMAKLAKHIGNVGACDILVNAAGIGRIGTPLHEMALEDFDAVLATNLRAPFMLMRTVVPIMIRLHGGHIVNISSLAGQNPLPNGAAYSASKWALNGLSYSVAEELRAYDIRVSVVAPGSVNTGFGGKRRGSIETGSDSESVSVQEVKKRLRKLQADDVAAVVEMLVTQPPQSFISEVRMRPTHKP